MRREQARNRRLRRVGALAVGEGYLPYRFAGIGNACGDLLRREDNILPYGFDLCPS